MESTPKPPELCNESKIKKIMKKFSIAILAILLTSIIFITQNDPKKMKTIETEITINAPADQVWKTFTKVENFKDWNPFH